MATITDFTNTITRITAGGTGSEALDKFNTPLSQIEAHLNTLATRIANQSGKSALVRKNVPMSSDVFIGALVYYNSEAGHSRFEPAIARLLGEPGDNGNSVEAPSSRVEGMVIAIDSTSDNHNNVTGTLLCGGYWEDSVAVSNCTSSGSAGVYYLSPVTEGHAVKDTNGHLRQPVLSYYGAGKFSLSLFYLAHDNHFHGSCILGDNWVAVKSGIPEGATAPEGAVFWYDGSADSGYLNIGELSARTTAVFQDGVLQTAGQFVVQDGYLWCRANATPSGGSVVVFNSYPFAYDSPVVRSVESTNSAINISNRNGLIRLTANEFISGAVTNNAYAVSAISGNKVLMTPVISDLSAGPGVGITKTQDGIATITATNNFGVPVDAYSIHHRQTNQTSDGRFLYITFPSGRNSELVINYPVQGIPSTTKLRVSVWCVGVGTGASFNADVYWISLDGSSTKMPTEALGSLPLSFSAGPGVAAYAESGSSVEIAGSGLLSATVGITTSPSTDIKLLRIGFRLDVISAATVTTTTDLTKQIQQVVQTGVAKSSIVAYSCLKAVSGGVDVCQASKAADCNQCIGVALTSANIGENVSYIMQGVVQGADFGFTAGRAVYVGAGGNLTQTGPGSDPDSKFIQRIGTALSSGVVQVNIETATLKGA